MPAKFHFVSSLFISSSSQKKLCHKKNICQWIASVSWLTFVECRSALKKEKNFESKYLDVKVKNLKQQSTVVCIFSYAEKKKIKNKTKVHKVHKTYHYN